MGLPALELAGIFREHGPAWRVAQRIQAAEHVVADGDVDGAQHERVEPEGIAVASAGQ